MKKTAVEWLYSFMLKPLSQWPDDMWDQAKEMEKKQIMDAYDEGWSDGFDDKDLNSEYYNETFKANEK
jgi:HEPN domain-containing protein